MIGVTGTSGKSSTTELIYTLLQGTGHTTGCISTIQFHIGETLLPNTTLRTTQSAWNTQKLLRRMIKAGCTHCAIEVSSHAIDQNRIWGIAFDVVVVTNISEGEHLDYHGTFADYLQTKKRLLGSALLSYRKPNIPKISVLNRDDAQFELFDDHVADIKYQFSVYKNTSFRPSNIEYGASGTRFDLRVPNNILKVETHLIGQHNVYNVLAAMTVASALGVDFEPTVKALRNLSGIPGRLESVTTDEDFSVLVDFSYKPSALESVLSTLAEIPHNRIRVVWGGAGGRSKENWQASGHILHQYADEIILTTDDPYTTNPKKIVQAVREVIPREEGDRFFDIPDRYEAMRYAIWTAQRRDIVLIAGRGHEVTQTIGDQTIDFDDREVAREILAERRSA